MTLHNLAAGPRRLNVAGEALLAGLVALLALAAAWQAPGPLTVDVGKPDDIYLTNFDNAEVSAGRDYRWAIRDAGLHFPGLGVATWRVTLVAAAGARPGGPPLLTIRAGGVPVLQVPAAAAGWQTYTFAVPAAALPAGDLDLALDIPVYRPAGENRDLGLAVDSVTLESAAPRLPAPVAWLTLAAALAVFYALVRLYWARRAAGVATTAAGLLLAGLVAFARLQITPYTSYLLMLAVLGFLGLYFLRAALRRYGATDLVLALAPALFLGYALVAFGAQVALLSRRPLPDDFVAFYRAAGRLLAHQPLYDLAQLLRNPLDAGFKYPPLFALLLAPVAGLSMRTALGVWNLANLGFLAATLAALLHAHGRRLGDVTPPAVALIALALLFQPLIDTLTAGQMDLAILGLVALTYAALRAGRPGWAGLPLAVAILFKLYPALLLVFLLLRRDWRALGSCALCAAVLVLAVLPWTGVAPWWDFLTVGLPHNGGPTAWIENQNFAGFFGRLLTDRLELEPFPPDPAWKAQLELAATGLWALGLLGATIWAARRPAARGSVAYALGFALFTAASVMVLPNAWYHYLTLLVVPLGIALFALADEGADWWARARRPLGAVLALLGSAAVVLAVGSHPLVWPGINLGGPWKLILSYKFYATVALWAALWGLLRLAVSGQQPAISRPQPVEQSSALDAKSPGGSPAGTVGQSSALDSQPGDPPRQESALP